MRKIRLNLMYWLAAMTYMALPVLLPGCTSSNKLTLSELEVLEKLNRAESRAMPPLPPERIYYVDSTLVYTPCGDGWYCRSRVLEKMLERRPLQPSHGPALYP